MQNNFGANNKSLPDCLPGKNAEGFFSLPLVTNKISEQPLFGRFQALMQFQCLKYFSAPKIFKSKNLSKLNIKVNINNAKSD